MKNTSYFWSSESHKNSFLNGRVVTKVNKVKNTSYFCYLLFHNSKTQKLKNSKTQKLMEFILQRLYRYPKFTVGKLYLVEAPEEPAPHKPAPHSALEGMAPLFAPEGATDPLKATEVAVGSYSGIVAPSGAEGGATPLPSREGLGGGSSGGGSSGGGSFLGRSIFLGDTLEPTWRNLGSDRRGYHLKDQTAIPDGNYPMVVTWSDEHKQWLPLLLHVDDFENIRIHAGHDVSDTKGNILVGQYEQEGQLVNTTRTLNKLLWVLKHLEDGEPARIAIDASSLAFRKPEK